MEATQLGKIKRSNFEDTLYQMNNNQTLEYAKHSEFNYNTQKNTIIHLYYNDNGHIGSWCNGSGWYFKDYLPIKEGAENG
jgi:hypothetical protein